MRVLPAEGAGPDRAAEVAEELALSGGSLVLTDVDRLPGDQLAELAELLEPYRESRRRRPALGRRHRAAGRAANPRRSSADLLSCFPRTVVVPPLRHHVEDVAELVPHLLARLGPRQLGDHARRRPCGC